MIGCAPEVAEVIRCHVLGELRNEMRKLQADLDAIGNFCNVSRTPDLHDVEPIDEIRGTMQKDYQ